MLVGESKQQNKAESVVRECLSNPMLDIDYRGATGSLIHITGGTDLTLQDAEEVATSLTYELDPHADVIWGARVRSDMEGKIRVLAIMTGVKSAQILGTRQSYKTMIAGHRDQALEPKGRSRCPVAGRLRHATRPAVAASSNGSDEIHAQQQIKNYLPTVPGALAVCHRYRAFFD